MKIKSTILVESFAKRVSNGFASTEPNEMASVLECRYLTPRRFQGKFEVVEYGRSIACSLDRP